MLKKLCLTAAVSMAGISAFATTTFQGKMTWVTGTLASTITISSSPQTISITVGTVTDTFTNTYVTGDPGTQIEAGTAMLFLDKGSAPFEATYSPNLNAIAYGYGGASDTAARRTVPMSSGGLLSYSVATQGNAVNGGVMGFYLPRCTVGGVTFQNGLEMDIAAKIVGYSLTVPANPTDYTVSPVTFPAGSLTPNTFGFLGYGNGTLIFAGKSMSDTCQVEGGSLVATPTTFTSARMIIYSGLD